MTILDGCRLERESKKYQARSLAGHSGSQILVLGTLGLLTLSFTPFGRSSHHPMHVSMMCAFMIDISMMYVSVHRRIPTFAEHHQVLPISKIYIGGGSCCSLVLLLEYVHSFSKISSSWIVEKYLRKYRRHYYLLETLSSLRSSGALMLSSSPHSFDHNGQWFLCFCVFTSEAFLCWHNCNLMITLANFCYLDYTKSLNKKISKSDSSLQLYSFVRQNYLLTLNAKVPTIKLGSLWSHPSTKETQS